MIARIMQSRLSTSKSRDKVYRHAIGPISESEADFISSKDHESLLIWTLLDGQFPCIHMLLSNLLHEEKSRLKRDRWLLAPSLLYSLWFVFQTFLPLILANV